MGKGQELYKRAKIIIPGGTQLLSKRPEMFLPDLWPAYYKSAKGCEVTDLDDKKYIDASYMGIGACVLGYADNEVNEAVIRSIQSGNMTTLNCPEEVELAELLINLHPWAEMVRYSRSGGESMSIAVRIARAYSKKDKVLFCGYHGWHDWYLSSNLSNDKALDGHLLPGLNPYGVPRGLSGLTIPFTFNNTDEFLSKYAENKNEIGAIVFEIIRNDKPDDNFLNIIKETSIKNNIPIIVDEITSGFRLNNGGAHLLYKFEPDIAVFAKGISNGFPMAAIIGKGNVMSAAQESFISSTYWTERIGPTAAIATIDKFIKNNVSSHLINIGKKVKNIWRLNADANNININISGIDPLSHFHFEYEHNNEIKTLFIQMMLEKGYLSSSSFYSSFAHKEEHLEKYNNVIAEVFAQLKQIIDEKKILNNLKGPVAHTGFKRLN